ncbi:MAG: AAA family ATPase [Pseudonocardiaceae bacterium]|nr:AAA family ATPase [Pseudonocardiaceae bacterium]
MDNDAARLVLINGAPGSGKSTLAQMYVDEHPLTLALDIDIVRTMFGRWLDQPVEAGLMARSMALQMARVQLTAGRDVLVPQFLGRLDFLLELERLCSQIGAEFIELVLLSSPQEASDRFVKRSRSPESLAHYDAQALLERGGGVGELPAMYDRLLEVVASRPRTLTVMTVDGHVEQAYRDLLAQIDGE